jgi:hypothetical protein
MKIFALVVLVLGCATVPPSQPVVKFPDQGALTALQSQPVKLPKLEVPAVPPVAWRIEDAASAHFQPVTPAERGERALAGILAAAGKPLRLSKAMSCVAREVGRYYLEAEAPPAEALRVFILGACGSVAREVGLLPYTAKRRRPFRIPCSSRLEAGLGKEIASAIPADASEMGVWFGRKGGAAMAVISYVKLPASLRPFPLVPDANGDVTVEGGISGAVGYLTGYINHGRFGVDYCFIDPTVPKPHFRITCHMPEGDPTAWVQLLYAQPGRVLSLPFAQFLIRRDPAAPLEYRPPPAGDARTAATAPEFAKLALEELNRVRKEAELTPVRLADAESATAGTLAGHYFAAAVNDRRLEVMDTIALGLLAGWQVGGLIRDANFVSAIAPFTRDVNRWVSQALEMPIGRIALLDAQTEEIALGPAFWTNPDMLGGLVVGYRFHHGNDHRSDVNRLLMRVVAARRSRSLPPPLRLAHMDELMREELARVNEGRATPRKRSTTSSSGAWRSSAPV